MEDNNVVQFPTTIEGPEGKPYTIGVDLGSSEDQTVNTVMDETAEEGDTEKIAKGYKLLNLHQQIQDIKDIKQNIIKQQESVTENKDFLEHFDEIVANMTVEELKEITPEKLDEIYTYNGEPIELAAGIDDPNTAFVFKRDFLIYKKESLESLKQIDTALEEMEKEMSTSQAELDALVAEFGDLSGLVRKKIRNDYESAILSGNSEKEKKYGEMLFYFDDSLTLSTLYENYKKLGVKTTLAEYNSEHRAISLYERYMRTMKVLKMKTDLTSFTDLEVKYLPEKYHKYPNLFLFAVIKYFAHKKDTAKRHTDGVFLSQFAVYLKSLYSGKWTNEENKETFLVNIQKVLDLFY